MTRKQPEANAPSGDDMLATLEIPEGWTAVDMVRGFRPTTAFLTSQERVTIRYFRTGCEGQIGGFVQMGEGTEGPPRHAHGGAMASVLDEAMGFACWIHEMPVLAARIEVDFRAPLPIPNLLRVVGEVTHVEGRKISTRASLTSFDGRVFSEATGLFVRLSAEILAKMT